MSARAASRSRERGYAMLLVFLMAAVIAIALYRELPRIAFEKQRAKEELLIERGEQYKRAIQLFVRKVQRYPATIEELENTNNIRFLRKRYIDPMTGKDKWRLIHINGGVLTDSLVQKGKPGQAQGEQQQANTNTFIGVGQVMGAPTDPNQEQINPALRRRASDDRPVVTQEIPDQPEQPEPEEQADNSPDQVVDNENELDENAVQNTPGGQLPPQMANQPGVVQPGVVQPMVQPGMVQPGMVQPGMVQPGMVQPGMVQPGMQPGMVQPGVVQPGMPPGRVPYPPGMTPPGYPQGTYPGQQGVVQPGMPGQPYNPGMYQGQMNPTQVNPGQAGNSGSTGSVGVYPTLGGSSSTGGVYQGPQAGMYPGQQPGMPNQPQGAFGQPAGQVGFGSPGFGSGQGQAPFAGQNAGGFPSGAAGVGGGAFGQQQNPGGGITMQNLGLTGPRPGGMQGMPGMGGTQIGGGIAGVASESDGPSIIVYNERKKYKEWEFIYDQSKDRGLAGVTRGGGAPGTPAGQLGNMPGAMPGQQPGPGGNTAGSAFGNSFGSAGGSAFGQSSPGSAQSPTPQPAPSQPPN